MIIAFLVLSGKWDVFGYGYSYFISAILAGLEISVELAFLAKLAAGTM